MTDATLLEGLRVVEFSQLIAPSLCGLTLVDYGADVIKIEPAEGEYARTIEPDLEPGDSAYFQMLNRGKRAVALDYRAAATPKLLGRLVATADIVVENLGDAAGALGLDPAAARARNPNLIWCSITGRGVGVSGRAIDPTLQASMGMMALNGERDGRPLRLPVPLVDFMTGQYAIQSILAAVLRLRSTGGGAHLDCALLDAAATLACSAGVYALSGGEPLRRLGTENKWYVPAANFAGSDGHWIQVMAISEYHWRALCSALDRAEWLEDPRMQGNDARCAHRDLVHGLIAEVIATRPTDHWVRTIGAAGAFAEPIEEIEQAWRDPRLAERGLVAPVAERPAFPTPVASLARTHTGGPLPRAPRLGQHSAEVARELGYAEDELAGMIASGALVDGCAAQR